MDIANPIIAPDAYPMIGIGLLVVAALIMLRSVAKILMRVTLIAGALLLAFFFVSGSAGEAVTGKIVPDSTGGFVNQVTQNLPDFGKMAQGVLPMSTGSNSAQAPIAPTPYMDIQSTYQNIVNQLKGVQATMSGK